MAATIQTILKPTRARGLDTSGNNNHGQIYSGRALEFDGVSDHLTTSLSTADAYSTTNFTIAAWYMSYTTNSYETIVGTVAGWSSGVWLSTYNNTIIANVNQSGGDFALHHTAFKTDGIIEDNTWYRIVLTYDSVSGGKIYLNGVEAKNSDGLGEPLGEAYLTSDVAIGATNTGIPQYVADGRMSDVQIWNSTWTADDVTYDYLNPEQLALNNGGTSLTNSNLKLWYPMNDGHRGNQSYVLDASNTGLGDELLTNGDFSDNSVTTTSGGGNLAGWTSAGTNDSDHYWEITNGQCRLVTTDGTSTSMTQSILTSGVTYRYSFTINTSADGRIKLQHGSTQIVITDAGATGTFTGYFTATHAAFKVVRGDASGANDITFDNVSVKAVNNKNNATTVFYGDERIDAEKNRIFASASNWTNRASSNDWDTYNEDATSGATEGTYFTDNYLHLEVTSDGANVKGAYLDGQYWEDTSHGGVDMEIGRTYRLSYSIEITAYTSGTLNIGFANASHAMSSNATKGYSATKSAATDYIDFVYEGTTNHAEMLINAATSSAFTVYFDNISLKEVGTATGWTDADQQLDIPQTALQSYNQLAWFDGANGQDATLDSAISTTTNSWSLSFLLFYKDTGNGYQFVIGSNSSRKNISIGNNSDLKLYYKEVTTNTFHALSDAVIPQGEWVHIVVTATADTSMTTYINGEAQTTNSAMSDTEILIAKFMEGYSVGDNLETLGSITEISYYDDVLIQAEVSDLYNDGKIKSALDASGNGNLVGYWRNNGLAEWKDLKGSNDANTNDVTETMLITAGVDSSRDSQGFLMNRQRATNCYNAPSSSEDAYYVEVKNSDTLKITGDNITMEAWVKLDLVGDDYARIMDLATGTNSTNGYGMYVHDNGKVHVGAGGTSAAESGTSVTVGNWHHLVCTTDGTNEKIYVDGALVLTASGGNTPAATTSDLWIGNSPGLSNRHTNGQIDDVRIYDKAFTLAEVKRNYNAGKRSHR